MLRAPLPIREVWGPIVQTRRVLYLVVFTALLIAGVEVLRRTVARLPGSSTTTGRRP